jgi:hypothetical protein
MNGRALAPFLALGTVMLLAGCDSGDATAPPAPTPTYAPPAQAPDPAIREAISAASSFDVGHTVHLTPSGIRPQALASLCCAPVVFKNETDKPVSVTFVISKISSGPIAPGSTWQWVPPNPESVIYRLGSDPNTTGQIQIESPDW